MNPPLPLSRRAPAYHPEAGGQGTHYAEGDKSHASSSVSSNQSWESPKRAVWWVCAPGCDHAARPRRNPSISRSHPTTEFQLGMLGDATTAPPFAARSMRAPGPRKRAVARLGPAPPSTTMNP
jgi:hypothetical protein